MLNVWLVTFLLVFFGQLSPLTSENIFLLIFIMLLTLGGSPPVVLFHPATTMDPDEGGGEELGWQLAGQLDARIVPRQRRSRGIQSF